MFYFNIHVHHVPHCMYKYRLYDVNIMYGFTLLVRLLVDRCNVHLCNAQVILTSQELFSLSGSLYISSSKENSHVLPTAKRVFCLLESFEDYNIPAYRILKGCLTQIFVTSKYKQVTYRASYQQFISIA